MTSPAEDWFVLRVDVPTILALPCSKAWSAEASMNELLQLLAARTFLLTFLVFACVVGRKFLFEAELAAPSVARLSRLGLTLLVEATSHTPPSGRWLWGRRHNRWKFLRGVRRSGSIEGSFNCKNQQHIRQEERTSTAASEDGLGWHGLLNERSAGKKCTDTGPHELSKKS